MINLTKYNLLKYTPHNSPIRKQNIKHFTLQPSRFAACPDERRGPGHPRRSPIHEVPAERREARRFGVPGSGDPLDPGCHEVIEEVVEAKVRGDNSSSPRKAGTTSSTTSSILFDIYTTQRMVSHSKY